MFHAVDILPTLMEIVSEESLPEGLDGVSHWSAMQTDMSSTRPNTRRMVASPRDLMVYNIDDELITEIFNVQNRTRKFQVPDFSDFRHLPLKRELCLDWSSLQKLQVIMGNLHNAS